MKGSVVDCIAKLVTEKHGQERWEQIVEHAGLSKRTFFVPIQDVKDETVCAILGALCKTLGVTLEQALDAFADYWMNDYGLKVYKAYYRGLNSSREFLLKMDKVHDELTKNIPNARPPRFEYRWQDPKTLRMTYKSERGLIDLMVSMAKAVGNYFKEELAVTKISDKEIQIVFPN